MLTPTIKGYAAEWVTVGMEHAMGALGGLGYMEETGIGRRVLPKHNGLTSNCSSRSLWSCRLIRDASVEKIWEGTVTVLAMDIVRAASKPEVLRAFVSVRTPPLHSFHRNRSDNLWCSVGRKHHRVMSFHTSQPARESTRDYPRYPSPSHLGIQFPSSSSSPSPSTPRLRTHRSGIVPP